MFHAAQKPLSQNAIEFQPSDGYSIQPYRLASVAQMIESPESAKITNWGA
jgi:hypothetical protein